MSEHGPLTGVHDETIYGVLNEKRGQSWFDKCNALEAALVKAGWTPPDGHPLAVAKTQVDVTTHHPACRMGYSPHCKVPVHDDDGVRYCDLCGLWEGAR